MFTFSSVYACSSWNDYHTKYKSGHSIKSNELSTIKKQMRRNLHSFITNFKSIADRKKPKDSSEVIINISQLQHDDNMVN